MSKRLKTLVINRLKCVISYFADSPARSVTPARGVRYFVLNEGLDAYCGAMNTDKEARRYRKHIIVRQYPGHHKLMQLYTYHFPTHWSQACQDNRALIKLAQRQAHALEHDNSYAALEWRIRFFKHYFNVFRLHQAPEPGFKDYSRFYQYTFVAIYRELKAAQSAELQSAAQEPNQQADKEITFEPIIPRRSLHADVLRRSLHTSELPLPPIPILLHPLPVIRPPYPVTRLP